MLPLDIRFFYRGFFPWFTGSNWVEVCGKRVLARVCMCVCVYVCGSMWLREHRCKTKFSSEKTVKITNSTCRTPQPTKKRRSCAMRATPIMRLRYCGGHSRSWSLTPPSTLAASCLFFCYFAPFQARWTLEGGWRCQGRCTWWTNENSLKHQCPEDGVGWGGLCLPWVLRHTVPFSCLGLWVVVRVGVLREGAKVQRKPASRVRPRPPQAQNMDQP